MAIACSPVSVVSVARYARADCSLRVCARHANLDYSDACSLGVQAGKILQPRAGAL